MTVRESLLPVLLGIAVVVGDNGSEDPEERVPFQKTALKREADYGAPQRSDPSHRSSPGLRAGEDAVNIANPPKKKERREEDPTRSFPLSITLLIPCHP